jgi:sugar/nucleoside kinase (ribokinase family)
MEAALRGWEQLDVTMWFVGHVSKDINVIRGKREIVPGGGVYYGSFAARSLSEDVNVLTKLNLADKEIFKDMEDYGINVVWISSKNTTSIENVYPTDNPDERISRMVSRADPFTKEDLKNVSGTVHITPLWHGEFPEDLIEYVREKATLLSGDAQGFLRNVDEDGKMYYEDWKRKDLLGLFDVFKLDVKEARVLTGKDDVKESLNYIADFGVKEIVLTSGKGVYIYKNGRVAFSPFGNWTMEGRTGRGDTAIAAYLSLRGKLENLELLVSEVARITTLKMKKKGPYKGWGK